MATYKDKSFWLATREYEPNPPLQDSVDVDVAVIGAGFTGLTSAYFLHRAESGLRIAVLEADVVGFGASGRNAGFSMTKIGMLNSVTKLRFGRQSAAEAHAYADRAVSLVATSSATSTSTATTSTPGCSPSRHPPRTPAAWTRSSRSPTSWA